MVLGTLTLRRVHPLQAWGRANMVASVHCRPGAGRARVVQPRVAGVGKGRVPPHHRAHVRTHPHVRTIPTYVRTNPHASALCGVLDLGFRYPTVLGTGWYRIFAQCVVCLVATWYPQGDVRFHRFLRCRGKKSSNLVIPSTL